MLEHNNSAASGQATGADAGAGIEIILLEKSDGGRFAKSYQLAADGGLEATPAPDLFSNLTAERIKLDAQNPFGDLIKIIDRMKGNQALALGRLPASIPDGKKVSIVYLTQVGRGDHGKDWIRRTGKDTAFAVGVPAPLLLDFDLKDYPKHVRDRVEALGGPLNALLHAVPELRDVEIIHRPSTSSGIQQISDGHTFPGGGLHAYVLLSDGSRSAEFLALVMDRCWEAGLGFVKVNKAGICQKACIVDTTVGRSERPCYEAPPTLGRGLQQTSRKTMLKRGKLKVVDIDAVPRFDPYAAQDMYQKALKTPEVMDLIDQRSREKEDELVAGGMTRARARAVVGSLRDWRKVPLAYDLVLSDKKNRPAGGLKVIDLLEDPGRWNGINMADPIEGPGYHTNIAMFYANAPEGRPKINTFAHGDGVYELADYGVQDAVEAVQYGLDLVRVVKVLGMPLPDVEDTLRALVLAGIDVDAKTTERARAWGRVASKADKAKGTLPFAENPLPNEAIDGELVDALRNIAEKKTPVSKTKSVEDWLVAADAALDAVLVARGTGTGFSIKPVGMNVLRHPQTPPKLLVPGIFPRAACSIVGPGETSKTTLAITIAIHVILDLPVWERQPETTGPVVFFSAEDKKADFDYMVHEVCAAMMLTDAQLQKVADGLHVKCLNMLEGMSPKLLKQDRDGAIVPTETARLLTEHCKPIKPVLVFFDPVSMFGVGERIINDGEAALMQLGGAMSTALDDACVCFIHHVSQAAAREQIEDAHAGRGGSAFGDNGRGGLTVYRHNMGKKDVPLPPGITPDDVEDENVFRCKAVKLSKGKKALEHLFVLRDGFRLKLIVGMSKPKGAKAKTAANRTKVAIAQRHQERVVYDYLEGLLAKGEYPNKTALKDSYSIIDPQTGEKMPNAGVKGAAERLLAGGFFENADLPDDQRQGRKKTYLNIAKPKPPVVVVVDASEDADADDAGAPDGEVAQAEDNF